MQVGFANWPLECYEAAQELPTNRAAYLARIGTLMEQSAQASGINRGTTSLATAGGDFSR